MRAQRSPRSQCWPKTVERRPSLTCSLSQRLLFICTIWQHVGKCHAHLHLMPGLVAIVYHQTNEDAWLRSKRTTADFSRFTFMCFSWMVVMMRAMSCLAF